MKRIFIIVVTVIAVVILGACSGNATQTEQTSTASAASASQSASAASTETQSTNPSATEDENSVVVGEQKEFVNEDKVSDVYSDPEALKGKYMEYEGKIYGEPESLEGLWFATVDSDGKYSTVTYLSQDTSFKLAAGDSVKIIGIITEKYQGKDPEGTEIEMPLISADSIEIAETKDADTDTKTDADTE